MTPCTRLRAISAYISAILLQEHLLLDFNERTIGVPSHVTDAIVEHITNVGLQTYPAYGDLNKLIADYAGVPPSQCMFTNGSDPGIDLIIRACCPAGTEAIIPSPTFAMYDQAALTEGLRIVAPHFTREGGFPTRQVLDAISAQTSIVVLSNPNNPTGTAICRDDMVAICRKASHCAVLVDECYFEYMDPGSSMVKEVSANILSPAPTEHIPALARPTPRTRCAATAAIFNHASLGDIGG